MDFLDPKKQRAHSIRLFVGYGLLGLLIILTTYALVMINLGYGYDRQTGQVIQKGLVYVDSKPESATVLVNGKNYDNTATRLELTEGSYVLELQRAGYRPWKRAFTIEGGRVVQYNYPFLFPITLAPKDTDLLTTTPGMVSQTHDKRWALIQQGSSLTNFDVVDLTANNTITPLVVPAGVFTPSAGAHSLQAVEWAKDNRHLLIKHTFGDQVEYVAFDREQPGTSVNVNKVFPGLATEVRFRNQDANLVYLYNSTTKVLLSGDLRTAQTQPVAREVLAYNVRGSETVLYVTPNPKDATKVDVKLRTSETTTYTVRQLAASGHYLLDMNEFNNSQWTVVGAASEGKVYVYQNVQDSLKTADAVPIPKVLLKIDNPLYVSFADKQRFIAVQSGSRFAVYDAETNRQYRYDTKLPLTDPTQKATWMDIARLSLVSSGQAVVFDFDGANQQTLTPANTGYPLLFGVDDSALFTIAPSIAVPNHTALVKAVLKAAP